MQTFLPYQSFEQPLPIETYITRCSICKDKITIIVGRPTICKNCKTNLAYLTRNSHNPDRKLNNLRIRFLALTIIKENKKIRLSDALRQAIQMKQTIGE